MIREETAPWKDIPTSSLSFQKILWCQCLWYNLVSRKGILTGVHYPRLFSFCHTFWYWAPLKMDWEAGSRWKQTNMERMWRNKVWEGPRPEEILQVEWVSIIKMSYSWQLLCIKYHHFFKKTKDLCYFQNILQCYDAEFQREFRREKQADNVRW